MQNLISTSARWLPRPHEDFARRTGCGPSQRAAFSMLELLAVITIIGIIATIIIPRLGPATTKAKHDACRQYVSEIDSAVERYFFHEGKLPATLDDLQNNPDYFTDPIPVCPVNKQKYALDTTTGRVTGHGH